MNKLRELHSADELALIGQSCLAVILDHTTDIIIFLSDKEVIFEFNKAAQNYYHWKREDVIGKTLNSLPRENSKYAPFPLGIHQYLQESQHNNFENSKVLKNDREHTIDWSIIPLKNYQKTLSGYVLIGKDVTDKLDVIKQSKQIQTYLETISTCMPGNFYWKDRDGHYFDCNNSLLYTLGLSKKEDIVGKTDYDLWPEQADELKKNDQQVMEAGKPLYLEETVRMDNNEKMYFTVIKIPLLDEKGNIIGLVGNSLNITEHKRTQEALKQAKEQAEVAYQTKTEFIANMNHDIRTPLSGIIGMSELIITKTQDPIISEYAQDIAKAGYRLLELANNILDLTQLDENQIPTERNSINLQNLLLEIKELFLPSFVRKNLYFSLDFDRRVPNNFIGNATLLHRIILNLIGNAIKFTKVGGITLRTEILKIEGKKYFIKFSIIDTGIGIEPDKLGVIFEPFTRLTPSYRDNERGGGLGLHIVKQFVERLNGTIDVFSQPEIGSTFSVVIPLLREDVDTMEVLIEPENNKNIVAGLGSNLNANEYSYQSQVPTLPISDECKILIVEDDEIAAKISVARLKQLNCQVDLAITGEEAIQKTRDIAYDLIYMDIGLPGKDGREVTQIIRAWEKQFTANRTPIIALTAHVADAEKKKCLDAGIDLVVSKPIKLEEIQSHIIKYVKNKYTTELETEKITHTKHQQIKICKQPIIDWDLGLKYASQRELLEELLSIMRREIVSNLNTIQEAYSTSNWQVLQHIVHKIIGSASYCGVVRLKAAAAKLDTLLREEDISLAFISSSFSNFMQEINDFLQEYP